MAERRPGLHAELLVHLGRQGRKQVVRRKRAGDDQVYILGRDACMRHRLFRGDHGVAGSAVFGLCQVAALDAGFLEYPFGRDVEVAAELLVAFDARRQVVAGAQALTRATPARIAT